ncbi:uncharacterized protein [Macrobrachium rosenbergii]|uniref:uncharacterized protein n=1 Tax=Macrobrachium rosenbergii TaxID=79674 RepID=UPI0034D79D25
MSTREVDKQTKEKLQERFLVWKGALESKGFKVNIGKTDLMIITKERTMEVEDGTMLKQNNEFNYFGSIITEEGGPEKEVRQSERSMAKMEISNWSCFRQENAIKAQNEDL